MADVAESQENAPAERAELTVPEMRQWLRNWVGKAVGKAPDSIDESVPMVELGLSSRDAVAMAADIEDLTGVTLSVAVAFASDHRIAGHPDHRGRAGDRPSGR